MYETRTSLMKIRVIVNVQSIQSRQIQFMFNEYGIYMEDIAGSIPWVD